MQSLMLAVMLCGATINTSANFGGNINVLSSGSLTWNGIRVDTVSLDSFDDNKGELISMDVVINHTISANNVNLNQLAFQQQSRFDLSGGLSTPIVPDINNYNNVDFDPYSWYTGQSGYWSALTISTYATYYHLDPMDSCIGNGKFNIDIAQNINFTTQYMNNYRPVASQPAVSFTSIVDSGTITVTYEYLPTPEPATSLLVIFGILTLAACKIRRYM